MAFNIDAIRAQFPALQLQDNGRTPIFLDNPAGTQVPTMVIDAVSAYYRTSNANAGGTFMTSQRTDAIKQQARETVATFLNAPNAHEIVFGPNMTTLTLALSRAIGQTLTAGDEIILTEMDHDANITPWLLMARDQGVVVKWVRLDAETGQLDQHTYEQALSHKTKLVCIGHAANALGTINPIKEMAAKAHAVGAYVFVDAVQSAPHLLVDVQDLDVDFLACSAYKFYGPHIGILYGRYELLEALPAYKLAASPAHTPGKWETGTQSYETLAGTTAAIQYLASLGQGDTLRHQLNDSYQQLIDHERALAWQLIAGLQMIPHIEIRGIVEKGKAAERVPTVVFRLTSHPPQQTAEYLAQQAVYLWSGHYYALETMRVLGHQDDGGMVRVGIAHYNTHREIDTVLELLNEFSQG